MHLKSLVTPSGPVEGFERGKKIQLTIDANTTLEELVRRLFSKNRGHVGFIVVNGKVVRDKVLKEGDFIEIYHLMGGG